MQKRYEKAFPISKSVFETPGKNNSKSKEIKEEKSEKKVE